MGQFGGEFELFGGKLPLRPPPLLQPHQPLHRIIVIYSMLIVHLSMQCVHLGWSRHHHVCMKDYEYSHNCMSTKFGSGRFGFFLNLYSSLLFCFSNCPILLLKVPYLLKILLKEKKN